MSTSEASPSRLRGVGLLYLRPAALGLLIASVFCAHAQSTPEEGVCDRTPQVRDALVRATRAADCAAVTDAQLATISGLTLANLKELTRLSPGAFAGLTNLLTLRLRANALSELPPEVFAGLARLSTLWMDTNMLSELPPGVFAGLARLSTLNLSGNKLTKLPARVFAGLANLRALSLQGNRLTELPPEVFAGLGKLDSVLLFGNRPGGVEGGVFSLPLRFELVSSSPTDLSGSGPASATVRVTLRAAAPYPLSANLMAHNARSSVNRVTLAAGSTQAGTFVVTRDSGATMFGMSFADVSSRPTGGSKSFLGFRIDSDARLILGEALPTLVGVKLVSLPTGAAYVGGSGEEIVVGFEFSGSVDVIAARRDGSRPTLTLQIGEATRTAVCSVAAGSPNQLACRYAPEFTDEGRIGIPENSLRLNGAQLLSNGVVLPGAPAFDAVADAGQSVEKGRVRLSFADAPFSAGEGLTLAATFDVVPAVVTTLSVAYEVLLSGAEVRAYADADDFPIDFAGRATSVGTVEVPVGAASGVIRIPVGDDDEVEPAREYFSVRLLDGEEYVVEPQHSIALAAINEGVCDRRTAQVRDALVSVTEAADCVGVTDTRLAAVETLDLGDEGVASLEPGDFSGLTNLLVLDLKENALTGLPPGVFAGLENLQSLWLDGNRLSELSTDVFTGLGSLSDLRLSGNALSELPPGVFAGLENLQSLWLDGNRLSELPAEIFTGLGSLSDLRLSGNALSELPAEIFTGLGSLSDLRLSGNALSELPAEIFTGLANLRSLNLSGNRPGGVEDGIFRLELQFELAEVSSPISSATVRVTLSHGAPWRLAAMLEARNGTLSTATAVVAAGNTRSATFTVTRDSPARTFGVSFMSVSPPPSGEFCSRAAGEACFVGLEIDTGERLVLDEQVGMRIRVFLEGALE